MDRNVVSVVMIVWQITLYLLHSFEKYYMYMLFRKVEVERLGQALLLRTYALTQSPNLSCLLVAVSERW